MALKTSSHASLQIPKTILQFYLKVLQNTETPKLTKTLENDKAKGLTNVN
jgi:hypothetical protein